MCIRDSTTTLLLVLLQLLLLMGESGQKMTRPPQNQVWPAVKKIPDRKIIFLTVGRNAQIANLEEKESKIVITGLIFIRLTPRGQQTH